MTGAGTQFVVVAKRDCPTCDLVQPVLREIAASGAPLTINTQDDPAVPALPVEDLLATSDIVSVSLPGRDDTRHFLNRRRVQCIKPGATLIHVGRGGVVDDEAVAEALEEGRLGAAAFDVFEAEPLPPDHPFLQLSGSARARLLLTPHVGGQTVQSKRRNFRVALDNVLRVSRGEKPINPVPA